MAAEREVIKEFLYSLGFQVDNSSLKRFLGSINSISGMAKTAGAALAGVAVAAEAMVVTFSNQMEKLYYASKRSKESVANIQALEFGFSQVGLSSDQARASIEGLAQVIRNNPGMKGYMDSLLGRDSSKTSPMENMLDLVHRLGQMPHFVGAQIAAQFGMDEKTFMQIRDNEKQLRDAIRLRLQLQKESGLDAEKAAENAKEYMNLLRRITEQLEIMGQKLAGELLPYVKEFTEWCDKLFTALNKSLNTVSTFDGSSFVDQIKDIVNQLNDLVSALGATDTFASALVDVLSGGFKLIKNIVQEALAIIQTVISLLRGDWSAAWRHAQDMSNFGTGIIDAINQVFGIKTPHNSPSAASTTATPTATPPSGTPTASPSGRTPLGLSLNNPGNLRFAGQAGAGIGRNGFAQFGSMSAGLDSMGKQLLLYGSRGLNTIAKIVQKYAPPNENDTGSYVNSIAGAMGMGANDQLNLKDPAVLSRLMQAMIRHEQGMMPFNAGELQASAGRSIGAFGGAKIEQQNTYHISGSGDPHEAGRAVGRAQTRSNDQLVRNLGGAVS